MDKNLYFSLERSQFPHDAEFSFITKYFNNEVIEARSFSTDNYISTRINMPGFYNFECIVKNRDSITNIISPFQYIHPEKVYHLYDKSDIYVMERAISKAHAKSAIECFKISANSQIHDFLYFPNQKQNLFVLCPSAIIRGKFPVPYFYRWAWAAAGKFPGNVIVMSDPTFLLDKALGAGWMVGTRENDATRNFAVIIKIFCKTLKIPFKNITFWGSSAGGFIAMQLSKYFPGSTAVSVNAQTNIYRFEAYGPLYRIGFPGMTDAEINDAYPERLTIMANIDKLKRNRILMIQNMQDTHHYENHFKPFMRSLMNETEPKFLEGIWNIPDSGFTSWIYSGPNGHEAETEEMAQTIIKRLGY